MVQIKDRNMEAYDTDTIMAVWTANPEDIGTWNTIEEAKNHVFHFINNIQSFYSKYHAYQINRYMESDFIITDENNHMTVEPISKYITEYLATR